MRNSAVDELVDSVPDYRGKSFIYVPFTYQIAFANLLPGATIAGQVIFQNDADFVLLAHAYYAFTANAPTVSGRPYPNMSVLLNDSGSGKNLSSVAVPVPAWFGDGQFPFVLPAPYLWAKKSVMNITLQNNDGATAYVLNLSFIGVKLLQVSAQ